MVAKKRKTQQPPILLVGRRGGISVVDAIVRVLWNGDTGPEHDSAWPVMRFAEIRDAVTRQLGYNVSDSTVRSAVYKHPELFEKSKEVSSGVRYRLSMNFRRTLK